MRIARSTSSSGSLPGLGHTWSGSPCGVRMFSPQLMMFEYISKGRMLMAQPEKNTYVISDSATELARITEQDALMNVCLDLLPKDFQIQGGQSVLDIGCGPG